MAWYYIFAFGLLIGIISGYMLKDIMPADIMYKGKIKQRGQNNRIDLSKLIETRKTKRAERKSKRRRLFKQKTD